MTTVHIEPADKEQEDIFTPGNVLICGSEIIVVVQGEGREPNSFTGVVLRSNLWSVGTLANDWAKDVFTKFHGTITIQST